jgi:hypothetical protein
VFVYRQVGGRPDAPHKPINSEGIRGQFNKLTDIARMCENNSFVFLLDSYSHCLHKCSLMKNLKAEITKRFVAAMLVATAVVGVSALAMHSPSHNQNSAARSLKSIQTDKTTLFYAAGRGDYRSRCVEMTGETRLSADNLKLIAAAF